MKRIISEKGWSIHGSYARLSILAVFTLALISCGSGDTREGYEAPGNDTNEISSPNNGAYSAPPPDGGENNMIQNADERVDTNNMQQR